MLETKDLMKTYKPKKGVPVTALFKVSLKFPEKGMVFLLGKSGSGKSTLLNVLGGLDKYDSGEIKIKGVSSKDFKQMHFDSYRNTYVGFIFQEYNILEDFSVGANIALAIELQNRKAEDEEINKILKEVDLEGYGNRKPNELSGGQKQRVAIARALVKNPQIIMADEPTGALDSNTGKQVFDTLKKLSKEKLVIVVSHDREFAELYADRIIELADGSVISDVELSGDLGSEEAKGIEFCENTVEIPSGYHLTEEDRKVINDYIDNLNSGNLNLKISDKRTSSRKFSKTDESKIKSHDGSTFKLIKSKLPLKNAFKIGASSLKYKKIRLIFTILLSCVAFGLFGLADTFGAYNHINACTNSIVDSSLSYAALGKAKLVGDDESDIDSYWREGNYHLSQAEIDEIEKNTGVKFSGVYMPLNDELNFTDYIDPSVELTKSDLNIFNPYLHGYAEINKQTIDDLGYKLLGGNLPDGAKNEIAVSEFVFEIFKRAKLRIGFDATGKPKYKQVNSYNDIIGQELRLGDKAFKITAVIDTNYNFERYLPLIEEKDHETEAESLVNYVLYNENHYAVGYSHTGLAMVGEGFIDRLIKERPSVSAVTEGYLDFYSNEGEFNLDTNYIARMSDIKKKKIVWLGEEKTALKDNELIVTTNSLQVYSENGFGSHYLEDGTIDYKGFLENKTKLDAWKQQFGAEDSNEMEEFEIVGFINTDLAENNMSNAVICSDDLFSAFAEDTSCYYNFAVGAMPKDKSDIQKLVSYCYRTDNKVRNPIQSSVTYELDMVNETLIEFSKIFLYIGLGFALFAALMLANFIGTSISYKKQEIGILRAIGSRSNDVFRIFFAESFIIAMINFVLSSLGVLAATLIINYVIRNELGILITVLNFGVRQLALLLIVSLAVAFAASFLPVKKIASKRPIDAIRNR